MKYFLLLSLLTTFNAYASAGMDRLNEALHKLDSVQAEFEQTVINDKKEVVQQSKGTLAIQKPGKFNWTYLTPYEQQIISDGKELWVYDVDLKQASVKPLNEQLANTPIMLLMKNQNLESKFNVHELGQKKYLYWLELESKQEQSQFEKIYFGLQDGKIMAMDLRDNFGQSTQIVFKNHRFNVIHNPATFEFEQTADIDVYSAQ